MLTAREEDIINAPRTCPNCKAVLTRRAKDNDYDFAKRVYCSGRCYRAALRNDRHKAYHLKYEGRYLGP